MRICLTLATTLALAALSAEAQMRIEGHVLDPSGQPLAGFTVNAADWHSAGGASASAQTSEDGSFTILVPPGIYAIGTGVPLPPLNPGLARADVRKGNVTGLNLRLSAQTLVVPDDPPRASLIEIIPSGSAGMAIVRGAAGAVSPGAFLILVTLDTGDATTAIASEDGSFQVPLHAPPGSSVLVKADPFGFAFRMASQRLPQNSAGMHLSLLAGTIVRAGDPPPEGERIRFVRSGLVTPLTGPEWTFDGAIADAEVNPGDKVRIEGMLRITSSALTGIGPMRVAVSTHLDRLAGPDGSGSLGMNTFASTLMTPTDFPIERDRNNYAPYNQHFDLTATAADRAEVAIDLMLPLPLAGTILHRGERASFAGYSAPTLPSKIEIVVTAPSGATRMIHGQASAIGWFYDPSQDFVVIESGVGRAKVKIHFDGRTSAGQVTEPFPIGDVLGSREGEFWFYVVDSRSAQLEIAGVGGPGAMARPSVILSQARRCAATERKKQSLREGDGCGFCRQGDPSSAFGTFSPLRRGEGSRWVVCATGLLLATTSPSRPFSPRAFSGGEGADRRMRGAVHPSQQVVEPRCRPHQHWEFLGSEAKDSPNSGDSSRSARLGATASARFVRPADGPIAITVTQPPVLTNIEMHVTTTIPGFILEEKRQTSLTYSYDAPNLAQDFPNLDLHDTGGDTVTISFLVSGTDPSGVRKHYARQVVIQGDELQTPDQPPRPSKRRAVR